MKKFDLVEMANGKKTGENPDGQTDLGRYEIATDEEVDKGKEMDGTQHEAVVVEIEHGVVGDFVRNPEKWNGNLDVKCVNVVIENENGVTFGKIITLPEEGYKVHPQSNLGKYISMYKKPPFVGQKVMTITKNGFQRLLLI